MKDVERNVKISFTYMRLVCGVLYCYLATMIVRGSVRTGTSEIAMHFQPSPCNPIFENLFFVNLFANGYGFPSLWRQIGTISDNAILDFASPHPHTFYTAQMSTRITDCKPQAYRTHRPHCRLSPLINHRILGINNSLNG